MRSWWLIQIKWVQSIQTSDSWIFMKCFYCMSDDLFAWCLFGVFAHWFWLNGFINCAYYSTPHTELLHNTTNNTTPLLASVRAIHRYMVLRILRRSGLTGRTHSRSLDQSIICIEKDHQFLHYWHWHWTFYFVFAPWQVSDFKSPRRVMMWSELAEEEFDGLEAVKGGKYTLNKSLWDWCWSVVGLETYR